MLCIPRMLTLRDGGIKKISFENLRFSAVQGKQLHNQVVYKPPLTPPPLHPIPRVGWAYVGSHHRDTLLRIPLPGTVLSG